MQRLTRRVDFHTHSSSSEGTLSPTQLVRTMKRYGIVAGAVTDHNTLAGVEEAVAAGKKYHVKIHPGIEFYTKHRGKGLHILGLNINPTHAQLLAWTERAKAHHDQWFDATVDKLRRMGFPIPENAREQFPSSYPAFSHLHHLVQSTRTGAEILKKRFGHIPGLFTLINQYFAEGKPAWAQRMHLPLTTTNAIKLVRQAGGTPVLAHPGQQLQWRDDNLIRTLKKAGLLGLEVYHPYHNWHQIEHYQEVARNLKLVASGGSDFHGDTRTPDHVANVWDYFSVPYSVYPALRTSFQKR